MVRIKGKSQPFDSLSAKAGVDPTLRRPPPTVGLGTVERVKTAEN